MSFLPEPASWAAPLPDFSDAAITHRIRIGSHMFRIHLSQIGGLTPARKAAALCEFFAVRTAWHGPGDVSPVGHAANVHLDLAVPNFGVQEARLFTQPERDVFPGCPELKDGYYWASDKPGLGIDLDEKLAAKFPITDDPPFDYRWGNLRKRDGSVVKP